MKIVRVAAILASVLFASATAVFAADGWNTLAPDGAQFSVNLPPGCNTTLDDQKDKDGSETLMWRCSSQGQWVYLIGCTIYPQIDSVSAEIAADRDNFDKAARATVDEQRDISTDGVDGIEFSSHSTSSTFRARVWVRGNRAYMIVAGASGTQPTPETTDFLNSFHFMAQ